VLEAEGVVEIKFRPAELQALARRLDPVARDLARRRDAGEGGGGAASADAALRARLQHLLPVYRSVALQYAAMHETPVRTLALHSATVRVIKWHAQTVWFRGGRVFWFVLLCLHSLSSAHVWQVVRRWCYTGAHDAQGRAEGNRAVAERTARARDAPAGPAHGAIAVRSHHERRLDNLATASMADA
jgi:Carboxyl transferase domain